MQKGKKRQLKIIQGSNFGCHIVEKTTCFAVQSHYNVDCQRRACQHWISHSDAHNCVILAAQTGAHTLQKIGKIYGLTRMRICQIEKSIFEKIKCVS